VNPDTVVYMTFTTVNAANPPVPTTLAGSPTIAVTRDDCSTAITEGVTLTVDFGSVTGRHHVAIDCAACNTAYTAGSDFSAYLAAGTVDGASVVGYDVGAFSIRNRSALMPTDAGHTLDVSAAGRAGLDWGNVENPTATVDLSSTTIKTATDVETDTADLQTRMPTALEGGRMAATVSADLVEGSFTYQDSAKLANAANAGKLSGAGTTTITIRDQCDTLDRIVATVDASGNRTAVVLDLT
jgi:hypothetical protein